MDIAVFLTSGGYKDCSSIHHEYTVVPVLISLAQHSYILRIAASTLRQKKLHD
jgi:hypothetical protein